MKPTESCPCPPFTVDAKSGLLSTAAHHSAPHQAQPSVESWPAERGAQSPTRDHEQEEADGEARPFPQPLFHGKQWHTGSLAVPARNEAGTFFPISCPALCHHSLLLPCLSLEAAAWPSRRGSLKSISYVPLSAGICSLIRCLWKAP